MINEKPDLSAHLFLTSLVALYLLTTWVGEAEVLEALVFCFSQGLKLASGAAYLGDKCVSIFSEDA